MKGWCIIPNTGVPRCSSAISVPQIGKPAMKDLVPSIGSSTQTYSASSRSLPNSSPTMPCWGKLALIRRRITASAARSASVTGSKSRPVALLSMPSEVRKKGRMVSPDVVASRPMKAVKSMTVTAVPWGGKRFAGSCGVRSTAARLVYSGGLKFAPRERAESHGFRIGLRSGAFFLKIADHEVESTTIMHRRNMHSDPPSSLIQFDIIG